MNSAASEDSRLHYFFLVILLLTGFLLAVFKIDNYDVWWHMKAGEYVIRHREVPRADVFSVLASGRKWVNPSWLADVMLYGVHSAGGVSGLIVSKAILISVTAGLLFLTMRVRGVPPPVGFVACALALVCVRPRMFARPLIFTYLLLVLLMYLIERHRRSQTKLFWAIPFLFALWANLHAGFTVGLAILALYAATCRTKQVMVIAVLSLAAALVNPFFFEVLLYPVRLLRLEFIREIREWMRPEFSLKLLPFWLMLVALAMCVLLTAKRLHPFDGLVVLGLAVLAVQARRHIAPFALVCAPILASAFVNVMRGRRICHPALALMMGVLFVGFSLGFSVHHPGLGVVERKLPQKAVDFVVKHKIPGNVFNEYEWGGYIIWRTFPDRKVFMDGRCLVYGDDLHKEWWDIYYGRKGWDEQLRKRNVGVLILDPSRADRKQAESALGTKGVEPFYENKHWKVVYWDTNSMVCARDTKDNRELIDRFLCEASNPGTLWRVIVSGKGVAKAVAEVEKKISEDPSCAIAYDSLGQLLMRRGRLDEALEQFRKCIEITPRYALAHYHLGVGHYRKQDYGEAIEAYKRAIALEPDYAHFHHNLGDAYLKSSMPFDAEDAYRQALRYDPALWLTWKNLAICCEQTGRYGEAIRHLRKANGLAGGVPELEQRIKMLEERHSSP